MPPDFEKQSYWRDRFSQETSFEWLVGSDEFVAVIERQIRQLPSSARILHIGSGTSDLHNRLRARGFVNVTNVDYEPLAVERGRDLEKQAFGDVRMEYTVADATQLSLEPSYDLVIDKSTADCISCGGEEALKRMVRGVSQCLAPGGIWISLSYSSQRYNLSDLPFGVEVLDRILSPKLKPSDPDIYFYCYLLLPASQVGARTFRAEQTVFNGNNVQIKLL